MALTHENISFVTPCAEMHKLEKEKERERVYFNCAPLKAFEEKLAC